MALTMYQHKFPVISADRTAGDEPGGSSKFYSTTHSTATRSCVWSTDRVAEQTWCSTSCRYTWGTLVHLWQMQRHANRPGKEVLWWRPFALHQLACTLFTFLPGWGLFESAQAVSGGRYRLRAPKGAWWRQPRVQACCVLPFHFLAAWVFGSREQEGDP